MERQNIVRAPASTLRVSRWLSVENGVYAVALIFGWVGLAGLLDGVVEWRSWFEAGWMAPWRAATETLSRWISSLFGAGPRPWVFDYLLVSPIYGVCYYFTLAKDRFSTRFWKAAAVAVSVVVGLFWAAALVLLLLGFALSMLSGDAGDTIVTAVPTRYAFYFYLSFVAVLAVVSTTFF